jgi:pimeloyl-ACP methyl ester carboxylesterase
MLVEVNGAKLYVDVENSGLIPDGARMSEKPTLLLLHGGPGFDHSGFKPAFSALSDVAQIVYYDHRGNGRSTGTDPATWNLTQWGDDVKGLCDALGIVKPIVCGLSFGGFVAQAYATRYPEHPGKLILLSTVAKIDFPIVFETFARLGGPEIGALAESYWTNPTAEGGANYIAKCMPFYNRCHDASSSERMARAIIKTEVAAHFNGPGNEHGRMDFRHDLSKITCPVLMMAGEEDPITPIPLSEMTAQCIPPHLVRFERLDNCGHNVAADSPGRVFGAIRQFILAE